VSKLKPTSSYCSCVCQCGHTISAYVRHYDIVHCTACGWRHWALRPERDGPLVFFPHPGHYWEKIRLPEEA